MICYRGRLSRANPPEIIFQFVSEGVRVGSDPLASSLAERDDLFTRFFL